MIQTSSIPLVLKSTPSADFVAKIRPPTNVIEDFWIFFTQGLCRSKKLSKTESLKES